MPPFFRTGHSDQNYKDTSEKTHGNPAPRAENFGDLKTAGHEVLSEGCESRNNHRYAVVLQDVATQLIQSYPSKTKTSQETERITKVSRAVGKAKMH